MPKHFGYGSNISHTKMVSDMQRVLRDKHNDCVLVDPVLSAVDAGRPAKLRGYRFALTNFGAATISTAGATAADYVLGMVYNLDDAQFKRLRIAEGQQEGKDGESVSVEYLDAEGGTDSVLTWMWKESTDKEQRVRRYYLELIGEAVRGRQLDATHPEYVQRYLEPLMFRRERITG